MISGPDPVQCRVHADTVGERWGGREEEREGGMQRSFFSAQVPPNSLLEECLPGAHSNRT